MFITAARLQAMKGNGWLEIQDATWMVAWMKI
jgi:hypothetical protein